MNKMKRTGSLQRAAYLALFSVCVAGLGLAAAPQSAFADGWVIDCFAPYDGCCACIAGTITPPLRSSGEGQIDRGETAYSCTKNAASGKSLCESNGTEGVCGSTNCPKGGGEV